ncbi:hypothetical protein [Gracilimonas sp.]|uniref:hypothetical protein n=1 Tax=Gracilimonas sp. TaxID=1974203 RepID=UPI0032EC5A34
MKHLFLVLFICSGFFQHILAQKKAPGFLVVYFNGESAIISPINDQNYMMVNYGDTLEFQPGTHSLTISYPNSFDRKFNVLIESGQIHKFTFNNRQLSDKIEEGYFKNSSYYYLLNQVNTIIVSDENANIYLGDNKISTGVAFLNINESSFSIKAELSSKNFSKTWNHTHVTDSRNYYQHFLRPDKKILLRKSFLPGMAHFYKYERTKGMLFLTGFIITSGTSLAFLSSYKNQMNSYNKTYSNYKSEEDETRATELGKILFNKDKKITRTRNIIYATSLLTAGVYIYNIIDGQTPPSIGFRNSGDSYLNLSIENDMIGLKGLISF